jgi:hypothetical protein
LGSLFSFMPCARFSSNCFETICVGKGHVVDHFSNFRATTLISQKRRPGMWMSALCALLSAAASGMIFGTLVRTSNSMTDLALLSCVAGVEVPMLPTQEERVRAFPIDLEKWLSKIGRTWNF